MGGKLIATSKRIIQTARSIPPGVRTWAARGLLGASLYVRGPERIRALIKSLNQYAKDLISDAIEAIPKAVADAVAALKKAAEEAASGSFAKLINFLIISVSGAFAIAMLLDFGPKLSFAASNAPVVARKRKR